MKRLLIVAVAAIALSCGGSSSPGSPSAALTMSGTIRGAASAPLPGATITILDGANANKTSTAGTSGEYLINGLQAGTFNVRVSASGYQDQTTSVALTSTRSMDFTLQPKPTPVLHGFGNLTIVASSSDSVGFQGQARNDGDACATNVAGAVLLLASTGQTLASLPWSLTPSTIVRPGDTLQYSVCCMTASQFAQVASYALSFSFDTAPNCP
jgi:Flp pilus assembly protein TadG